MRDAAIVALGINVLMPVVAIVSIMLTVPKGTKVQTGISKLRAERGRPRPLPGLLRVRLSPLESP